VHHRLGAAAELAQHFEPGGVAGLELQQCRFSRRRRRSTHDAFIGAPVVS
jgi:hypothetical protein